MRIKIDLPFIKFDSAKSASEAEVQAVIRRGFERMDGSSNLSNVYKTVGWYYAAANKISRNCARVKWDFYSGDRIDNNNAIFKRLQWVNDYQNIFLLIEGLFIYKSLRGEAFVYLAGEEKIPDNYQLLDPLMMSYKADKENGQILHWTYINKNGAQIKLDPDRVLQIKYYNPFSPLRGLSPVKACAQSISLINADTNFQKRALTAGGPVAGVIKTKQELSDAQYKRRAKEYKEMMSGQSGLLLLEGDGEYTEAKLTAQEMQTIERHKMDIDQLLGVMEVPKAVVGLTDGFNYANMKAVKQSFWTEKLIPELLSWTVEYNTNYLDRYFGEGRYRIQPNFDDIPELQQTIGDKIEAIRVLTEKGVPLFDVNEKLELGFDLEKYSWTKTWWAPFSLQPAETLMTQAEPEKSFEARAIDFMEAAKDYGAEHKAENDDPKREKDFIIWKSLVVPVEKIEKKYASKISDFFMKLRSEILKNFRSSVPKDAQSKDIGEDPLFDMDKWTDRFRKLSAPFIREAMQIGGNTAWLDIGLQGMFDIGQPASVRFLETTTFELKQPIMTIEKEIRAAVQSGIAEGGSIDEIAEKVETQLRKVMNKATGRARVIAQTETIHAANGAKQQAYAQLKIKNHRWINSFDARVRDIHQINEVVEVGQEFSNGLKYPGDRSGSRSTPDNLINCRCITTAEMEGSTNPDEE